MKSNQLRIFIALLLAVGLTSCMKDLSDQEATDAPLRNNQEIKNHLLANQLQDSVTATATGLYYIITPSLPNAKKATPAEELEFTYVLSYIDTNTSKAVLVDSTNRTKPVYIPFLTGVVIPGLEEGLLLMKEGQTGRFYIPSNIAFGSDTRDGKMPRYSAVIFDVKLKRSRTQLQQMDDFASIKKLSRPDATVQAGTTSTDSVRVYRLTKGTGAKINEGQTVTVAYTANTLRGATPFDKSDSLTVKLGSGQYITGFDRGIAQLSVGDKAWLVFPSGIGYGSQGSYDQSKGYYIVPPYTPLAFEITVKSAK